MNVLQRLSIIEFAFLISVIIGPAAAYSKVYLFHLVLALLLMVLLVTVVRGRPPVVPFSLRWDVGFFGIFLGWYALSTIWAEDKLYALQYCLYVGLGIATVYFTTEICRSLDRLRAAVWVVLWAISVQVFLAILEGARLIRLPSSPYSPHRWFFGREVRSFEGLTDTQIHYLQGVPTGFAGNPNNLAAFLVLALPLFLFARRWWVAALGVTAIYFVIDMAGARSGIIGFWIVIMGGALFFATHRLRTIAIAIAIAAIVIMPGFIGGGALNTPSLPGQIEAVGREAVDDGANQVEAAGGLLADVTRLSEGLTSGKVAGGDSVGIRTQLILNGLEALRESHGLGVGAGGSLSVQKNSGDETIGAIASMHNFWVELLVDGGVIFAALFFSWAGWLVWRLWQVGRSSNEPIARYLGRSISLGFVGFFFAAIGPSSVIYMLPMWMFIGLSLAVIRLNAENDHDLSQKSIVDQHGIAL